MKPIKILAIGNSFSVDATTYLHQFSLCGEQAIIVGNLHYGGCSLKQHLDFFNLNQAPYEYHKNGALTNQSISLREALKDEAWDYITIQQNSGNSGVYDSFIPGIELCAKLKDLTHAQFVIHKTWSYASYYRDEQFAKYHFNQREMDRKISYAYSRFAKDLNIQRIIPSADAFTLARAKFGDTLNRDGFHANEKGRYLLAALWYSFFTKKDVRYVNFVASGFSYKENSEQGPTFEEVIKLKQVVNIVISNNT